jgi:hypothetical protein
MTLILIACLALLSAIPIHAQSTPKSVTLTQKSNVPTKDLLKPMRKECPNVTLTSDPTKSDYTLEATKTRIPFGVGIEHTDGFSLILHDPAGVTVHGVSNSSLGNAVKDLCEAIRTSIVIEVVDSNNLTLSVDMRGSSGGGGVAGAVVNGLTGRRTHTDSMTIYVIVKGEHALLDCYEHRTGCATIAPGKYYGTMKGDGIWIDYEMPLTHEPARNHYKIAGSW